MANFTLSTSQITGGGGTVTVTPVSATVFTGRKATGTVTIKNGITTKTVSLSKDYPLVSRITDVTLIGGKVTDWREFNIPSSETPITVTYESNKPNIQLLVDDIEVQCSVKIGSKWYDSAGVERSVETFFPLTGGNTALLDLPSTIGLSSKYVATIKIKVPANTKSYLKTDSVHIDDDSLTYIQAGATPTLAVTPTSLSWSASETAGKAVTVTSNGSTIPVTVA